MRQPLRPPEVDAEHLHDVDTLLGQSAGLANHARSLNAWKRQPDSDHNSCIFICLPGYYMVELHSSHCHISHKEA